MSIFRAERSERKKQNRFFLFSSHRQSNTVLIYRDSTGNILPLVSGEKDQIAKDNTDPMPFVRLENLLTGKYFHPEFSLRIISGLNRNCDSPHWKIIREGKKKTKEFEFELNTTIGDSPFVQLENTQEYYYPSHYKLGNF